MVFTLTKDNTFHLWAVKLTMMYNLKLLFLKNKMVIMSFSINTSNEI